MPLSMSMKFMKQVRRLKKNILKHLPPKQRSLVEVHVEDEGARRELQEGNPSINQSIDIAICRYSLSCVWCNRHFAGALRGCRTVSASQDTCAARFPSLFVCRGPLSPNDVVSLSFSGRALLRSSSQPSIRDLGFTPPFSFATDLTLLATRHHARLGRLAKEHADKPSETAKRSASPSPSQVRTPPSTPSRQLVLRVGSLKVVLPSRPPLGTCGSSLFVRSLPGFGGFKLLNPSRLYCLVVYSKTSIRRSS